MKAPGGQEPEDEWAVTPETAVLPMPCTTPRDTMQGWGAQPHTCPEEPHSPGPLTPTSPIAVAEVWEAPDIA